LKTKSWFRLLGLHWAQFAEEWELTQSKSDEKSEKRRNLITDGAYVAGFSGMTSVIPAWQILEVLDIQELTDRRHLVLKAAARK
jgi:hypothetical protein